MCYLLQSVRRRFGLCSFFVTLGGGGRPQGRAPLPTRATNLARKTPPHQPAGHLAQHRFQLAPAYEVPAPAGTKAGVGCGANDTYVITPGNVAVLGSKDVAFHNCVRPTLLQAPF